MKEVAAIVLAGGSGERLAAGVPKALVPLAGRALFLHSLEAFAKHPAVRRLVVVTPPGEWGERVRAALPQFGIGYDAVVGGARRRDSVRRGLEAAAGSDTVLIHDSARPFVAPPLIARVLEATLRSEAAIPVLGVAEMLVRADRHGVVQEVPREALRQVQTPQGFRRELLVRAHDNADRDWDARDDASMVRALGHSVEEVRGDPQNFKLTWPGDLERAEIWMRGLMHQEGTRIGLGWDVHPLKEGRPFVLIGVRFESQRGPIGHSDGDPLAHAVADALLGAACLGDIGQHFSDTDPAHSGLAGDELLRRVVLLLNDAGFAPHQVDAVLIADEPKIAPQRDAVRTALAAALRMPIDRVSLKGKRTEGLGSLARGAGIACHAIAAVRRGV